MATLRARLDAARAHQQAGRLMQAEQIYRQILQQDPRQADSLQFLGLQAFQRGDFAHATTLLEQAAQAAPSNGFIRANLGAALQSLGRIDEAIACYERALAINPALAHAHNNLAVAQRRKNRVDLAITHGQRAIGLRPDYAEAHSNLGNALRAVGRLNEALQCQLRAVTLKPDYAEAHNNLGLSYDSLGDFAAAEASFRTAIRLSPRYAEAYDSLGSTLRRMGRDDEARQSYERALALDPQYVAGHNNLGALLHSIGRADLALPHYQAALAREPDHILANQNAADCLHELGEVNEATVRYRRALELGPTPRLRLIEATLLPPIYESQSELDACRARLEHKVAALATDNVQLDPAVDTMPSLFYLAYAGEGVRSLLQTLAGTYRPRPVPLVTPPGVAGVERPLRVGFISRLFKNHTIGRLTQGFIGQLSRPEFEVTLISRGRYEDEIAQRMRARADRYVEIPEHVARAAQTIRELGLDVLYYTDVGMDPLVTSLAYHRLAPVQCATWGHPVTTASPTIDYFVSGEAIEPAGAEREYTERLVRLARLPAYYERPSLAGPIKERAAFGLPEDAHLYLCPQSLFKFHPAFDQLLAEILRRDRAGRIVLVEASQRRWNSTLAARFARVMPDVCQRVIWIPRQSTNDFLQLLATADVLLDPIHFGGGNTAYEGLALGVPIVTWPGPYMRGRVTLGCYRQMDVLDAVADSAEQYVELAVRLGVDREARTELSGRLLAARHELFEDRAAVDELEAWLLRTVTERRD